MLLRASAKVSRLVAEHAIDVLHAHTRVSQVVAALVSLMRGIPYVSTCHGFFKKRLGRSLWGCWGHRTVAISEEVARHLAGTFHVPDERIAVIPTGIDAEYVKRQALAADVAALRSRYRIKGGPVIGAVGRLSPVKGYDIFINAAREIATAYPDSTFLIVGGGPDEARLKTFANERGIGDRMRFVPAVMSAAPVYMLFDVFVFPSRQEGLGLSLMEAMALGVPCVASDTGGIRSLVTPGETGLLFRKGDPHECAACIRTILANPREARARAVRARESIERHFGLRRMLEECEKVYLQVVRHCSKRDG